MGWVEELAGKSIALDTAPLIYFLEQRSPFAEALRPLFQLVDTGQATMVTSVVTLLEVLVLPLRSGNEALAQEYRDILLNGANLHTVAITPNIAYEAARLRAESRLKTPDAIQLATAMLCHADVLITNDRDFGDSPTMHILRLSDLEASQD